MEPSLVECIVSGALGIVLRMSQVCGIAALRFEYLIGGWRIRVSKYAHYYGLIVIGILNVLSWFTLIRDLSTGKSSTRHVLETPNITISIISECSMTTALFVSVMSNMKRMTKSIICLEQIHKVKSELNQVYKHVSFGKVQKLLIIWSVVRTFTLFATKAGLIFDSFKEDCCVLKIISLAYFFKITIIILTLLQITLICSELITSLNHLNICLEKILREVYNESINAKQNNLDIYRHISYASINNFIDTLAVNEGTNDTAPDTIHNLSYLYGCICEVAQEMDSNTNIILAVLLLCSIVHNVIMAYLFINIKIYAVNLDGNIWLNILKMIWWPCSALDTFVTVEVCQYIHNKINYTKNLISLLLRFSSPENHALRLELETLYKVVMTTPTNIFKFKRTFITTIIGPVTTYLFLLVQM